MTFSVVQTRLPARLVAFCLLATSLSGCATLPISGPTAGRIERQEKSEDNAIGFTIKDLTPEALADVALTQAIKSKPLIDLAIGGALPRTDVIRRGDVLNITIFEVGFSLFGGVVALDTRNESTPANAQRVGIRVDDQGNVDLPYIGHLHTEGSTPAQVQTEIQARMRGLSQSPQALVSVAESIENSVYVSGSVARPGRVRLTSAKETLLDVVALSGGATVEVDNVELRLIRAGQTGEARLGSLRPENVENIVLLPGDRVELVNRPRTFTIFGASDRIAQVPFGVGILYLSEALARAGGPADSRADPRGVFLFRYVQKEDGTEQPLIYRINMMNADSYFLTQRFPMQDKDVLFFSNSPSNLPSKLINIVNLLTSPVVTAKILTQN